MVTLWAIFRREVDGTLAYVGHVWAGPVCPVLKQRGYVSSRSYVYNFVRSEAKPWKVK